MRKVELLPTRDCKAGYGPGLSPQMAKPYKEQFADFTSYLVEMRNRKMSLSLLNSWAYLSLSWAGVLPSRRLYT